LRGHVDFEIVSASSSQSLVVKPAPRSAQPIASLYDELYPMVWGILGRARIWRDAERSELAHDVFIVALELYPARDPAAPEAAWLAAITWNVARNYRSRKRVRAKGEVDVTVEQAEPVSTTPSPEEAVGRRRLLLDLLDGLDDDRRMVFDMHEIEGFDVPEIAHALAIPVGTARTRLRLAREHVQAARIRLEARAARAEGSPMALPALLPFGVGAWRELGRAFEEAPPGMEQQVWRSICRTISAGHVIGSGAAATGAAMAAKTAGSLLATGALVGGGAMFLALRALTPSSPVPHPPPSITQAPDTVAVAPDTTSPASSSEAPSASPTQVQGAAAARSPTGVAPSAAPSPSVNGIDPEEESLIQQAQAAIARKNYGAARAALTEHTQRFPNGQLGPDRRRLLAQIPDAGSSSAATPGNMSPPPSAPTGSARNRMFGTDE
jgi:RNA polymerase sigma-70 factor (ECF subfamily)